MSRFYEKYSWESRFLGVGWYCLGPHDDQLGGILILDQGDEPLRLQWESIAKRKLAEELTRQKEETAEIDALIQQASSNTSVP
jgi:hypothetical protein